MKECDGQNIKIPHSCQVDVNKSTFGQFCGAFAGANIRMKNQVT